MTEKQELEGAIMELHMHDITAIAVYYEGSGDSGAIDEIRYIKKQFEDLADLYWDDFDYIPWNDKTNILCNGSKMYDIISDNVLNLVLDHQEDWWNNEGGFGYYYMAIPSGEYRVENNIRVIQLESTVEEDNLLSKLEG